MLVFSFFLAISIIIWLLNALSKNYTAELNYPITYSDFPEGKVLISDIPNHLRLKVNAHGYAILSYKLSKRPIPISFQISTFAMNRMPGDSSRYYLLTRYARERISRQLPAELQLVEISPDSLIFQFATQIKKNLIVLPNLNFKVGRDFTLKNGIAINPDTIVVTGPDLLLDTMSGIPTKPMDLGELEKDFSGTLTPVQYKHCTYSHDKIKLSLELEKLTEVQVMVPVQVSGVPDSIRMQTFPQQIRVTGRIGLSQYDRIVPEAFWAEVSFNEAGEGKSRLPVQLKTQPRELTGVSFYPQTVEYLLTLK